jgi:hypothetical protein
MHTGLKVNREITYQRGNNEAMPLYCNLCDEPIKFDSEHISEKNGKRIPLDIDTDEPHDCAVWRSQQEQRRQTQKRLYNCRKGCGQFIYFDVNQRTKRGTWIPLEKETGLPHQCQ